MIKEARIAILRTKAAEALDEAGKAKDERDRALWHQIADCFGELARRA